MKTAAQLSAAALLLSGAADAFWRMPCTARTGLARIDPLVNPGQVAPHSHAIHGGKNFGLDTTYNDLVKSECTSCRVTEDKSAYWTPALNFIHEDGTTEVVPQIGGMLAYYLLFKNDGEKLEAFPPGFQMLTGDTRQRNFTLSFPDMEKSFWSQHPEETTQKNLGLKALGFNCLNYAIQPEPSMYRHFLPDKGYMDQHCPQGIRAEIFFPSCWNGELDSPNHKDHVAYPDLVNGGKCPDSHPRRIPSLFYETIWFTNKFNGKPGQFVFSNGDPTGYGYHADFINGWDQKFLQSAIDTCGNPSGRIEDCPVFQNHIQSEGDTAKCTFEVPKVLAQDNCDGSSNGLCGNVPIQAGPAYASDIAPGNPGKPTGGYTPPAVTQQPSVPTLSYAPAKSAVTDEYGGGISVMQHKVSPTDAANIDNAAAPAPTPAPQAEAIKNQSTGKGSIIGTSTFTSAGVVHEVVIEEVDVYVTVDAPAPAPAMGGQKVKRHGHAHVRRDKEHGLLGKRHFH